MSYVRATCCLEMSLAFWKQRSPVGNASLCTSLHCETGAAVCCTTATCSCITISTRQQQHEPNTYLKRYRLLTAKGRPPRCPRYLLVLAEPCLKLLQPEERLRSVPQPSLDARRTYVWIPSPASAHQSLGRWRDRLTSICNFVVM